MSPCRNDDLCIYSDLPPAECAHCTGATSDLPSSIEHPWAFNGQHVGRVVWSGKDPLGQAEVDMPARPQPPKPTTPCHWDADAEQHMLRSHLIACRARDCTGCEPCVRDEHGTPVRHCRHRKRCTSHLALDEHTCPRCLALIRGDLTLIVTLTALVDQEAIAAGPDSDALSLAAPAANVVISRWRRIDAARAGEPMEETDWDHPAIALAEWERRVREDLGHDAETIASDTLSASAGYLDWVLTDLARDAQRTKTLAELASGVAETRAHLEGVMHDSRGAERGAPCPICEEPAPRLLRRWHETDTTGTHDTWRCPRDDTHWWYEASYRKWVADDYLINATWLSAPDLERAHGVKAGTTRALANRPSTRDTTKIRKRTTSGRWVYNVTQVLTLIGDTEDSA